MIMEAKEMKEKFVSLYNMMATGNNVKYMHTFGDTTRKMFDWLVVNKPDIASEFLSQLESIKWHNYLTKAEADSIIAKMNPSAPWDMKTWKEAMDALGIDTCCEPYYNEYALYIAMCQVYSDHGNTIAKMHGKDTIEEIEPNEVVKCMYSLAIDLLKDKDGVYDIRKYFLNS